VKRCVVGSTPRTWPGRLISSLEAAGLSPMRSVTRRSVGRILHLPNRRFSRKIDGTCSPVIPAKASMTGAQVPSMDKEG
jgi:hypothetical protein